MENENQIDLKALREEKGLSFQELADAINISENFYRKIERKVVSLTAAIAEKLSAFYQIPIQPYFIDPSSVDIKHRVKNNNNDDTVPSKGLLDIAPSVSYSKSLNDYLKKKNMNLARQLTKLYKALSDIEQVISDAEFCDEEDIY